MNTPQNKERFFAQYWGQNVLPISIWGSNNKVDHIFFRNKEDYDKSYLELTSLSDISDEDAIDVAKLILQKSEDYHFTCSKVKRNIMGVKYPFLEVKSIPINRNDGKLNRIVEFSLMEFRFSFVKSIMIYNSTNNWIKTWETQIFPESINNSIDYLRSRGYALPFMGISVQDQIEFGWIKLKIK